MLYYDSCRNKKYLGKDDCDREGWFENTEMEHDEIIADTLKCLRSKPGRPDYVPWYIGHLSNPKGKKMLI